MNGLLQFIVTRPDGRAETHHRQTGSARLIRFYPPRRQMQSSSRQFCSRVLFDNKGNVVYSVGDIGVENSPRQSLFRHQLPKFWFSGFNPVDRRNGDASGLLAAYWVIKREMSPQRGYGEIDWHYCPTTATDSINSSSLRRRYPFNDST